MNTIIKTIKSKKNKSAFSIAELGMVILIIGFLSVISINVFKTANPKVNKLKFKNANTTFKHALNIMISNPFYFSPEGDLSDESTVTIEGAAEGETVSYTGTSKFRQLMLREMNVPQVPMDCFALTTSKKATKTQCYAAENGIIWSFPNTNFKDVGVVKENNSHGGISYYSPVTIYIDAKNIDTIEGFNRNAIIIGVRRDGAISLIKTLDCEDNANKEFAQCDIIDMFSSLNPGFKN